MYVGGAMRVVGGKFVDEAGRTLILRGCNLGGNSKVPATPEGSTWKTDSLKHPEAVSFVGRPFPIEEADEHLGRLASWGFTFLRFLITWEAVEHAGPGIYDESYLAYVRKVLKKAEEHGISVFIDPHQDVWSRWTGGDGAPAWTLEKLGFDLSRLFATGSALTHQEKGDPFPRMAWPTNYNRYAAATMFTIFFAGDAYAPQTKIEGESAQGWLQARYFAAMKHAFRRLKDCKAIVGWGSMNEPHSGFIGYRDLSGLENTHIELGPMPTAFQAMVAASGRAVGVDVYGTGIAGTKKIGKEILNPGGLRVFKEGFDCPWKREGVWTDEGDEPRLLKKDHFATFNGRKTVFADDFLKPFMKRFAAELRDGRGETIIFIEGVPTGGHPSWGADDGSSFVNAFHWYDGATLFTKSFRPWFSVRTDNRKMVLGRRAVAQSFAEQLRNHRTWALEHMGGMPCLLGEFGLPFDMNRRRAFTTGDYSAHEEALSMYYDAVDANLLHSTIWNYTASNTHERGDGWNDEDLSIWSGKDGEGDAGARAIAGWRRPYPMATAGSPLSIRWDRHGRLFEYRFRPDPAVDAPTEIYAPLECFGDDREVIVTDSEGQPQEGIEASFDGTGRRLLIQTGAVSQDLIVSIRGRLLS
jgi:hypothetical protein